MNGFELCSHSCGICYHFFREDLLQKAMKKTTGTTHEQLLCMMIFAVFICLAFLFATHGNGQIPKNQWRTIQELNANLEKHFTRENQTTEEKWNAALPNEREKVEISSLVLFLMIKNDFSTIDPEQLIKFYPELQKYITISIIEVDWI